MTESNHQEHLSRNSFTGNDSCLPSSQDLVTPRNSATQAESSFFRGATNVGIDGSNAFTSVGGSVINVHSTLNVPTSYGVTSVVPPQRMTTDGRNSSPPTHFELCLQLPPDAEHASEVYARLLIPKKQGYPLWFPQPRNSLAHEYRRTGMRIGDVGIVTTHGDFDFLFNICLPANDPINDDLVPENFKPISPAVRTADIRRVPVAWPPGKYFLNGSVKITTPLGSDVFNDRYRFECQSHEGAILTLPEGALQEDLLTIDNFHDYAGQNAVEWYKYANITRGRRAPNGSLYLITGYDKAKSWGTASFLGVQGSGSFGLNFTSSTSSVLEPDSYAYMWNLSGLAETKEGPPVEYFGDERDRQCNQSVFFRGFKIMLAESLWDSLFRKVSVLSIVEQGVKGMLPRRKSVPFRNKGTSFFQRKSSSPTRGGPGDDLGSEGAIVGSVIPFSSTTLHPLDIINRYLLGQAKDAKIAISHDSVWCSMLPDTMDTTASRLDDKGFLRLLELNYNHVVKDDIVTLVLKLAQREEAVESSTVSHVDLRGDGDDHSTIALEKRLRQERQRGSLLPGIGPTLPPPPVSGMRERDKEQHIIVRSLLESPNAARIAILGMAGIGKTSLACEVMRHPDVQRKYSRQYFVTFEDLTTLELVYTAFANALSIPAEERNSNICSSIKQRLQLVGTLLCCDNFETFWEPMETRGIAEELLASLSSLTNLSILVTLRGTQRPNCIRWTMPQIPPLEPLTMNGSKEVMVNITGKKVTESARKLLREVEGLPLAVTLISNLLRDGIWIADALWEEWKLQRTRVIKSKSNNRQANLDISIELSVNNPRVSNNPDAKLLLAALAILPYGLSNDPEWLLSFQKHLPTNTTISLEYAFRTLQSTGLITTDTPTPTSTSRIRLSSPIRHFCLSQLSRDNDVVRALIALYTTDKRMSDDVESQGVYLWISQELPNIRALLKFALESAIVNEEVGAASRMYTWWSSYLCLPSDDIIKLAIDKFSYDPDEKGSCLNSLGELWYILARYEEALELLEEALELHRTAGSKGGEAKDCLELGKCYKGLQRWDEATASLESALKHYRELDIPTSQWEAYTLSELADVRFNCGDLDSAVSYANQAVVLFREHSNVLGQANVFNSLGKIFLAHREFVHAKSHLKAALRLSEEIKYELGQCNALWALGDLDTATGDSKQAILHYKRALLIAEGMHDEAYTTTLEKRLQDARSPGRSIPKNELQLGATKTAAVD